MAKILIIDSCEACDDNWDGLCARGRETIKKIPDTNVIPDWCKLEDAQKKDDLIKAAVEWREWWCDTKDEIECSGGCDCKMCRLMRACDNYKEKP